MVDYRAPMGRAVVVVLGMVLTMAVACGDTSLIKRNTYVYEDRCPEKPAPGIEWSRCQLKGANLRNAKLQDALLIKVDLSGADLRGADLREAALSDVLAEDADLRGANLEGASVIGGNIQKARFCKTIMPSGSVANGDC